MNGRGNTGRAKRSVLPTLSVLCAVLLVALPPPAGAAPYASSQRPHWHVGRIDAALSGACRRGRFNQIAEHRLFIAYRGEIGAGVTGIGRRGWNLRDPDGMAADGVTYHFADDGLSTCRVYAARDKPPS
jgi:hypothetical protein